MSILEKFLILEKFCFLKFLGRNKFCFYRAALFPVVLHCDQLDLSLRTVKFFFFFYKFFLVFAANVLAFLCKCTVMPWSLNKLVGITKLSKSFDFYYLWKASREKKTAETFITALLFFYSTLKL